MSDADVEFLQSTFRVCRFHQHLGLSLVVLGRGKVEVHAKYREELDQGMGMLHGAVYGAVVDTATYYAALSHYGPLGKLPLTQEYKLNLLSSARGEDIKAVGELLKAGRTVAVAEAKVYSAAGKLLAAGLASMVIPA